MKKTSLLNFLTLFSSTGTLICCALPALLVSLGMGAALAGMLSYFPWLIQLSENKEWVFSIAFVLTAISGVWIYSQRNAPCPIDPNLRDACIRGRKYSFWIWLSSAVLLSIGALFAYALPWLFS